MVMVETSVTKHLYKIELFLIKVIPYIIAGIYLANSILSYFNIRTEVLSYIGGLSLLPLLFLYLSSFVFKFCVYHRLPLYYIAISDIINYFDYLIGIPVSNRSLFVLHIIIAGITIFLIIFLKLKICVHK